MNEEKSQLTLRELLAQCVSVPSEEKPTWKKIETKETALATFDDGQLRMNVFPSGYVTAHSGRNHTVFHISACRDYVYRFEKRIPGDTAPHEFSAEYFMDLRWEIRVLMEAEDRLTRNNDLYEFGHAARY